jgi:hypothetical protein
LGWRNAPGISTFTRTDQIRCGRERFDLGLLNEVEIGLGLLLRDLRRFHCNPPFHEVAESITVGRRGDRPGGVEDAGPRPAIKEIQPAGVLRMIGLPLRVTASSRSYLKSFQTSDLLLEAR